MMNTDEKIDELVKQINAAPHELKWAEDAPPSVRWGTVHNGTYESWDWNIKSSDTIDWVEDLEAQLPGRFPKSFRSLITRYIFPQFEVGDLEVLANTPEGMSKSWELRTGIFADKYLSAGLLQNGFIQFARPAGGSYDPICFDTNTKNNSSEYPIVCIDHEEVLCNDRIKIKSIIASSFLDFIALHLKVKRDECL